MNENIKIYSLFIDTTNGNFLFYQKIYEIPSFKLISSQKKHKFHQYKIRFYKNNKWVYKIIRFNYVNENTTVKYNDVYVKIGI